MALILYRYAGSPDASGMVLREFADGDSVSAYAVDAIRWAVHEGLISGMGEQHPGSPGHRHPGPGGPDPDELPSEAGQVNSCLLSPHGGRECKSSAPPDRRGAALPFA